MSRLLELLRDAVDEAYEGADTCAVVCSGGLDSSTIACLAGEQDDDAVQLYTGWYREPGFDERVYARLVRGFHHEVEITARDFVDVFDDLAAALTPPWQGVGCFGQYVVAEVMAQNGVEVVLSGEGADELFGGYARVMYVAGETLPDRYPEKVSLPDGYPLQLKAALEWEMSHLQDLLAVDEQILRAHGLEGRAPFMDPRVVEYALELPATSRVWKRELRRAVRGVVPEAIVARPDKMGFPVPFVKWAQEEPLRGFLLDRIGRIPNLEQPWDRSAWYELLDRYSPQSAGFQVGQQGEEE